MWFSATLRESFHGGAYGIHPDAPWLAGCNTNVTSQFGEDGIIRALLEHFGQTSRWCFEIGAGDGLNLSNTWSLRNNGWHAVLIEGNPVHFPAFRAFASDKVHCVEHKVSNGDLDTILQRCGVPGTVDLGSIDVDGQDYWLWKGMTKYAPRIMLVEYNPYAKDEENTVPDSGVDIAGQATMTPIVKLGDEKGYSLIAYTATNAVFLRKDVWTGSN